MTSGLKPLDQIFEPDSRQGHIVRLDGTGELVPLRLADLHDAASSVILSGTPPPDVVTLFDRARNLYVYSWFVYDFTTSAQAQAYAAVEMALRERLGADGTKGRRGLRGLFEEAMKRGWLKDGGFPHIRRPVEPEPHEAFQLRRFAPEGTEYCETLLKVMPSLRNDLAHGSFFLVGSEGCLGVLEVCAAIINQLFPLKTGPASAPASER